MECTGWSRWRGGLPGVRADGCQGAWSVAIKESGQLAGTKAGLGN